MPEWTEEIRRHLGGLRLEPGREAAIVEELSQHLEDRYQDLRAGGSTEAEACQAAFAELAESGSFGEAILTKDRLPRYDPVPPGDSSARHLWADMWRDVRYAARMLAKNPGFTFFVVLTLALGTGANTTVFTVINTLILNPIPVKQPSRLEAVSSMGARDAHAEPQRLPLSYQNLKDLQAQNSVFSRLAGYTYVSTVTWRKQSGAERLFTEMVTNQYFETLAIHPAKGRFFLAQEDTTPGSAPVAVINYGTWQMHFGGEPDILGKVLRLNDVEFTIVGVAPKGFIGLNAVFGPDLWIPATMIGRVGSPEVQPALQDRGLAAFHGVGRLKAGVERDRAQGNVTSIAASLEREYPKTNEGHSMTVEPVSDVLFGDTGGTISRGRIVMASSVLLVIVGLILLIACSNVANLLLARSEARRQEIAVRLAMGASRVRLMRQLLTESVLLGLLSGAAGVGIGYLAAQAIWTFRPADKMANLMEAKLDTTVLLYALLISFVSGIVFGIGPAIRASRAEVIVALKEEARTSGRNRRAISFSNVLLVGQVAFSFLALVTAALFLRSMQHAYQIDPGFETKRLALFITAPGQAGYSEAKTKGFYRQVRAGVESLPGVASVSWSSSLPLWGAAMSGLEVEGKEKRRASDAITTVLNTVDFDYFVTAGVPITRGRGFRENDGAEGAAVAVVNETLAHRYWPDSDALGKRIRAPGESFYRQIVGEAKTANYQTIAEPKQPCVYIPLRQNFNAAMTLYVRTQGDAQRMLAPVERILHTTASDVVISEVRTGGSVVKQALGFAKMGVQLLSIFGLLALALASIGLYGIMSFSVRRRSREIGLRMALGAGQMSVLGMILKQGLGLVGAGLVLGLALSLVIARGLSRLLYGVSASDPMSLAAAMLLLLAVTLLACYLPARGATRVDPLVALREG